MVMTIDKVKKLISTQLNVAESKITEDSRLVEDLGADSLDTIELLMAFEEEFGISIPDEEAMNMKTIKDIVNLIDSKN
ncbi:MAG: acyl carrier protein [Clostridia bacterium]|nr:acyl carrier protein [Clostridia bacterium]